MMVDHRRDRSRPSRHIIGKTGERGDEWHDAE
jgi:hypothetical protein